MRASHITVCGLTAYLAVLAPLSAQTVAVAPAQGRPGLSISLTGASFADNEAVDVYLDTTDTMLTVSSSSGALATALTIPMSEQPGTHYVTAVGRRSGDAAQVAFNVTTAWTEQGYGAAHLSWNPFENTISTSNVATLGEEWTAPTSTLGSTPVVAGGRVFVTTNTGIQALSTATGAVLWNVLPSVQFYGAPAVSGAVVFAMGGNGPTLYALSTANGKTKWMQTLGQATLSSPVVVNGVVYIGCEDHKVYALDAATGAIKWSTATGNDIEATPAVVDGVVYVGSMDDKIYALNALTGAVIWTYATGAAVEGSPSVANGILYEGSDDGKVYALRTNGPNSGTLLWSYTTGSDVYQAPAVAQGVVYIGSVDGNEYAIGAHTGSLLWSYTTGGIVSGSIVANNVVYVTARDGTLYALNASYGGLLASAGTGYAFIGSPAISDGVVYVNSDGANTYAYSLLGGTAAAKRPTAPPSIASLHPNMSLKMAR